MSRSDYALLDSFITLVLLSVTLLPVHCIVDQNAQLHREKRASWIFFPETSSSHTTTRPGDGSRLPGMMVPDDLDMAESVYGPVVTPTNPAPNACNLKCANQQRRERCIVSIRQCSLCGNQYIPFCASDGTTYINKCWLQCSQNYCNPGLKVKFEGVCPVRYRSHQRYPWRAW